MTEDKIEALLKRKNALTERKLKLDADERFYLKEKERLSTKLQSLGYNSLAEAKEALVKLELDIDAKCAELEKLLSDLESGKVVSQPAVAPISVAAVESSFYTPNSAITLDEL